jgi:hypothetical protein
LFGCLSGQDVPKSRGAQATAQLNIEQNDASPVDNDAARQKSGGLP